MFKNIKGKVAIGLPEKFCRSAQSVFSDLVRIAILSYTPTAIQVPQLLEKTIGQLASSLPDVMGQSEWLDLITEAFAAVIPWFNGDIINTAVTYAVVLESQKSQFHLDHPDRFYDVQIGFWSLLLTLQDEPGLLYLLKRPIDDFYDKLEKHRMGLFAWLVDDRGMVDSLIADFENNYFDRVEHVWENSIGQQNDLRNKPPHVASARVDYLLLKQLSTQRPPTAPALSTASLVAIFERWGKKLAEKLLNAIKKAIEKTGRWVRSLIDAAGNGLREAWDKTVGYIKSIHENGKRIAKEVYQNSILVLTALSKN